MIRDDVEAATEKSSAQSVEQAALKGAAEEAASATPKQPKLMTMEEIYNGMLEAEQQRIKAARPDTATNNKAMIDQWGVQIISVSYAADVV